MVLSALAKGQRLSGENKMRLFKRDVFKTKNNKDLKVKKKEWENILCTHQPKVGIAVLLSDKIGFEGKI